MHIVLLYHFSELICGEQGVQTKKFTDEAIECLQSRSWTGNIRELRNVVESLTINDYFFQKDFSEIWS